MTTMNALDGSSLYLSCAPEDAKTAMWIREVLEGAGGDVGYVHDKPTADHYLDHVEPHLARGGRVLALWSRHFFVSGWRIAEAAAALGLNGASPGGRLIPVLIDRCEPPAQFLKLPVVDIVGLEREAASAKLIAAIDPAGAGPQDRGMLGQPRQDAAAPAIDALPWFDPHAFFGRDAELTHIHNQLSDGAGGASVVIAGPSGVGKTALARAYCDRYGDAFDLVHWVDASAPRSLVEGLAALAVTLDPSLEGLSDVSALAREARRRVSAWTGARGVLVVFDQGERDDDVGPWRPDGAARVLIVRRSAPRTFPADTLSLAPLSERDAARILLSDAEQGGDTLEAGARDLAIAMGCDALGLAYASGFLRHNPGTTFTSYARRLRHTEPPVVDAGFDPIATKACWSAIGDVAARHRAAGSALSLLAWCAPGRVPVEALEAAAAQAPNADDAFPSDAVQVEDALAALERYGLVTRDREPLGSVVSVHPVVNALVRAHLLAEGTAFAWAEAAIGGMAESTPGGAATPDKWARLAWVSRHADELDRAAPGGAGGGSRALLANQTGLYLQARADYAAAEPHYQRALELFEAEFGTDHQYVAVALNNLAGLLVTMNRLEDAEPLVRRALAIEERSLGPHDPVIAERLKTLARLMQSRGGAGDAEPLMRRVVEIYEFAHGPDHPLVAAALNALADLTKAAGRTAEAETLMRRALAIDERAFGPEHPNVAVDLNNLGQLLKLAGRFEEAERAMRRALAIDEKVFGPQHPEVATDLHNFAKLLHARDRVAEAEPLMRRAVQIWETTLRRDHPHTRVGAENLAAILRAAGRGDEARTVADTYGLEEQ